MHQHALDPELGADQPQGGGRKEGLRRGGQRAEPIAHLGPDRPHLSRVR